MEVMKANIAYKFELMPTREQTRIFAQAAGCRRFVWNKATELQRQRLEHNLPFLNYAELCEKLTCWKQEDDMLWLQDAPSQALQQGLKDECASINLNSLEDFVTTYKTACLQFVPFHCAAGKTAV